jgi:hypothetical protein
MVTFALAALVSRAEATEIGSSRKFGLGIQLGEPTALTGKLYLGGRENALDFALGTRYDEDWGPDDSVFAQVSYHWHLTELTSGGGVAIPFRIGVGGFLDTTDYGWDADWDEDFALGARVPFGLDFDLESAPVQFYVELAPEVFVLPPIEFEWDAGVGVRYYF